MEEAKDVHTRALDLARQTTRQRIREEELAETADKAERAAIEAEIFVAEYPAAVAEIYRKVKGRTYFCGSCAVCEHDPSRPGYRWIRWTEIGPDIVTGKRQRLQRVHEDWCPHLACPHRPGDEVPIMCDECGQGGIVPWPGLPADCPNCGGTMQRT